MYPEDLIVKGALFHEYQIKVKMQFIKAKGDWSYLQPPEEF